MNSSYLEELNVKRYLNQQSPYKLKEITSSEAFRKAISDRIRDLKLSIFHSVEHLQHTKELTDLSKQVIESVFYVLLEYTSGKLFLGYVYVTPLNNDIEFYLQPIVPTTSLIERRLPIPTKEDRRANPFYTSFRSFDKFCEGLDNGEFRLYRVGRQSRVRVSECVSLTQLLESDQYSYREDKLRKMYGGH